MTTFYVDSNGRTGNFRDIILERVNEEISNLDKEWGEHFYTVEYYAKMIEDALVNVTKESLVKVAALALHALEQNGVN